MQLQHLWACFASAGAAHLLPRHRMHLLTCKHCERTWHSSKALCPNAAIKWDKTNFGPGLSAHCPTARSARGQQRLHRHLQRGCRCRAWYLLPGEQLLVHSRPVHELCAQTLRLSPPQCQCCHHQSFQAAADAEEVISIILHLFCETLSILMLKCMQEGQSNIHAGMTLGISSTRGHPWRILLQDYSFQGHLTKVGASSPARSLCSSPEANAAQGHTTCLPGCPRRQRSNAELEQNAVATVALVT